MRRWKGLARSRTAVLPRRIGSSESDGLGLGLGLGRAGSGGSAGVGDSERGIGPFGVATARDGGESMGGGVLGMLAPCSEGWPVGYLFAWHVVRTR